MHASAGWYGDHTVDATSDGVTVRKGLDLDTLALPALKFEIRSERDDPVGVRVVDRLPATVDPERVGVHADFAADQWTAFEDGRVTFTTRIDPERPVVTLYGIWMDDPSRVHELLGSPDVMVASDPDAPSLAPVGDEVALPTVDNSLRSVGPDALKDLRADVEEALTAVRADPSDQCEETATALPAGAGDGDADGEQPAGTMGDHAWTYPVERMGTGRIATPTHADLDDLVDDDVEGEHVYLRAALAETHHGGGGALLLQELANAFEVVARRVTGDDERSTVDAVVQTPLGTDAVLSALSERDQVTDALVSPLVGDREDATGIDATPEGETAAADRAGTEEVSIEPDSEDVEVVLNADGERFDELKSEFEHETDTDALEDELAELELPGVDTTTEPSIDELVDGDDVTSDDEAAFVPASVDGSDDDFAFDTEDDVDLDFSSDDAENASGLDFATDAAVAADDDPVAADGNGPEAGDATADAEPSDVDTETADGAGTETATDSSATVAETEPDAPFDFDADAETTEDESGTSDASAADDGAFQFDGTDAETGFAATGTEMDVDFEADDDDIDTDDGLEADDDDLETDDGLEADDDSEEDTAEATASDDEADVPAVEQSESKPEPADPEAEPGVESVDGAADSGMMAVPAEELAALRTEIRELRDRVATLEGDLAAMRSDVARTNANGMHGDSADASDESDDADDSTQSGSEGYGRDDGEGRNRPLTDGDGSVDPSAESFESRDVVESADDAE